MEGRGRGMMPGNQYHPRLPFSMDLNNAFHQLNTLPQMNPFPQLNSAAAAAALQQLTYSQRPQMFAPQLPLTRFSLPSTAGFPRIAPRFPMPSQLPMSLLDMDSGFQSALSSEMSSRHGSQHASRQTSRQTSGRASPVGSRQTSQQPSRRSSPEPQRSSRSSQQGSCQQSFQHSLNTSPEQQLQQHLHRQHFPSNSRSLSPLPLPQSRPGQMDPESATDLYNLAVLDEHVASRNFMDELNWQAMQAYEEASEAADVAGSRLQQLYSQIPAHPPSISAENLKKMMMADTLMSMVDNVSSAPEDERLFDCLSNPRSMQVHKRSSKPKSEDAIYNIRYKTQPCMHYQKSRKCPAGENCHFAHGPEELRRASDHAKYKTQYCQNFWTKRSCPFGVTCFFVHDEGEKRQDTGEDSHPQSPDAPNISPVLSLKSNTDSSPDF